jgi:hypothetical protein
VEVDRGEDNERVAAEVAEEEDAAEEEQLVDAAKSPASSPFTKDTVVTSAGAFVVV